MASMISCFKSELLQHLVFFGGGSSLWCSSGRSSTRRGGLLAARGAGEALRGLLLGLVRPRFISSPWEVEGIGAFSVVVFLLLSDFLELLFSFLLVEAAASVERLAVGLSALVAAMGAAEFLGIELAVLGWRIIFLAA